MSFDIHKGEKASPVGKSGLMSRKKANFCLAASGALANLKVIRGQSDDFFLHANNAVLQIKEDSAANTFLGMHPFKLYATGEVDGSGFLGYNVRNGLVSVRPRYHVPGISGLEASWFANSGFWGIRVVPQFVDDGGPPGYTPDPLPTAQFYLDSSPEIDSGNWGSYYSFWIENATDTDNGSAYDGTTLVNYRRFSVNPGSALYPLDLFPFPTNTFVVGTPPPCTEYIPIGFVQVAPCLATSPLLSSPGHSGSGLIYQILNGCVDYDRAGENGSMGFHWWGEWDQTGNNEGTRVWYPGDVVTYAAAPPFGGTYLSPVLFQSGGTPASPVDTGMQFVQIGAV